MCALRACGSLKDLVRGYEIHSKEQLEGEIFVCNSLEDMYAECGSLVGPGMCSRT